MIGSMKAGTTSLAHYLRAHPQVHIPERKELYFFTGDENWTRGTPWYESQFEGAGDALAVGEACVGYSMHPVYAGVPERITTVLPRVRLIYLVREPVDRMISHYRHRVWHGEEDLPIERALLEHEEYLETSRYAMQVERYLGCFDDADLLIIRTEELKRDRAGTLRRVFRFLRVNDTVEIANADQEFHQTAGKRRIRPMADRIRGGRPYRAASKVLPRRMRGILYRLGTEWISDKPEIGSQLRASLCDALRDDVERLTGHIKDPSFDGWGIVRGDAVQADRARDRG